MKPLVIIMLMLTVAPAVAQQRAAPARVGALALNSCPEPGHPNPFVAAMADLGWVVGRNYVIDCILVRDRFERLPELAEELVSRKVDLIVTYSTRAVTAAQRATRTIPIVMLGSYDAVREGLVASLARPGGNITGLTDASTMELLGKRVQLLSEIVPGLRRLAVLRQSGVFRADQFEQFAADVGEALQPLGVRAEFVSAINAETIDEAFGTLARDPPDALHVIESPLLVQRAEQIAALAVRHRLPMLGGTARQARAGALLSYGANFDDSMRLAVGYIDRILKGADPAELPVVQPTKFDLVVNLRTAAVLGLTIPPSLLARADEVIE